MPRISVAEPVTQLKRIKIAENGEPLVDFLQLCPKLVLDKPRFHYRRETVVRRSVAEKLCEASDFLPSGFTLAVIEGWRAPLIQMRMYAAVWNQFKARHPDWSDSALKRIVNQFSAPMDLRVPPPHTTGAAVDVTLLTESGNRVDLSSPYEFHDPKSFPLNAPGLTDAARFHRQILSDAVIRTGLTNYPSEYWHYSFGDQGWAYRGGHDTALYAAITPVGWKPEPSDVSEQPLAFVEEIEATA